MNNEQFSTSTTTKEMTTTEEPVDYFNLEDGRTKETFRLIEELGLVNPGENGDAVILPKNISKDIKRKIDEGYKLYGLNSFVSSLISLNRILPDSRPEQCKKKVYDLKALPKCSIIIIFHNEEWTVFLRTIHSILSRSPLDLIEEVLLVDDASDRGEIKLNLKNIKLSIN